MNFLQICQEAYRLSGLQGTLSTVEYSTGYEYKLVRYVAQAWLDIQNLRKDWPFMRSTVSFSTVADTTEYSLATLSLTDLARWHMLTYTDANSKEQRIYPMSYDQYLLDNIASQESAKPRWYAVDPIDKHLYLNPPDAIYSVTGHYITESVELTSASDEPLLPDSFHMLLAYTGAAHMASFMGQSVLYQDLAFRADVLLGDLMRSELPKKRVKLRGIA